MFIGVIANDLYEKVNWYITAEPQTIELSSLYTGIEKI